MGEWSISSTLGREESAMSVTGAHNAEIGAQLSADVTVSRDGTWRSAVLRPVGELAGRAIERFVDDLMALAERANIVVVSLVGASVPRPAALARALRRPGALLSGPDKALLLVGADDRLLRELRRHGGHIAAIPA
jgi:hypothetical protein